MHVLLIHQVFAAPYEAGGTRHFELARHWVRQGHSFTAVTSDLTYLTGQRAVARAGLVTEQTFDGVRVLRAYTYPSLHRSFAWRVVSFLSFMVTSMYAALRAGPVDVVMGTSPPIFQAVSTWLVALVRQRPFLLEIRDLWPVFAIDLGVLKNPLLIRLSRWLEHFLYARASHLLVNSPAYRDYLIGEGVAPGKISLVANGIEPELFDPDATGERIRREWQLDGSFVIAYVGALGLANDIPTILKAAERLREQPRIRFVFVGDGKERTHLEALARERQLTNVTFIGPRPKTEVPEILAAADICVATLKDISMFRTTYPNKVFDYMAAGRPVVLAIDGVIRQVVEAAEGGVFVQPGDDAALAEAVRAFSDNPQRAREMGAAARAYVVKHFNRAEQAIQFAQLIHKVAERRKEKKVKSWYRHGGKRLFDVVVTAPLLILLLPLYVMLALLVRLTLGSPILFRQVRPGWYGKPFTLLKFRTMTDTRDAQGNLLPDAERLTWFGRVLRSTSLDELPELWNVLWGHMSLVGPRPLLMRYLGCYSPQQMRRHGVKPGLTGWAQVNGRNAISWEQKFQFDVWYVDNWSLGLDVKIIGLTVWKMLTREGISSPGQATMEEFVGSRS